nr:class I SAM-dependent methyltransferase [Flexivirga oryzae]
MSAPRYLELGIGTGRVAVPLAKTGATVVGVDVSERMLDVLSSKESGIGVRGVLADMADLPETVGEFDCVYTLFNSFSALQTQCRQLQCMKSAHERLASSGCFIVQVSLPEPKLWDRGQRFQVWDIEPDRVILEASRVDTISQQIDLQRIVATERGLRFFPWKVRYVWPSEMVLLAKLAGFEHVEQFADWDQSPIRPQSFRYITIAKRG